MRKPAAKMSVERCLDTFIDLPRYSNNKIEDRRSQSASIKFFDSERRRIPPSMEGKRSSNKQTI